MSQALGFTSQDVKHKSQTLKHTSQGLGRTFFSVSAELFPARERFCYMAMVKKSNERDICLLVCLYLRE